jgi:hypothetical protein
VQRSASGNVIEPHHSAGRPADIPEGEDEDASRNYSTDGKNNNNSMTQEPREPGYQHNKSQEMHTLPRTQDFRSRDDASQYKGQHVEHRGVDLTQYAEQQSQECCCCLYNLKCAAVSFNVGLLIVFGFTTVLHILYDNEISVVRWQEPFWKASVGLSVIGCLLLLCSIVMIMNKSIFSPGTYGCLVFTFACFMVSGGLNLSRASVYYDGWILFSLA